jgi:hypothetical protein
MDALGCPLQKVEMERAQPSASAREKHGELALHQMAQRARVRGLFALMSSTSVSRRMDFVNRDLDAAIHTRRCAVLKTGPWELTPFKFLG